MVPRALLLALAMAAAALVATPAAADPAAQCDARPGAPCELSCEAGDVLRVDAWRAGDGEVAGSLSCGVESISCSAWRECAASSPRVIVAGGRATCEADAPGSVARCSVAHNEDGPTATACRVSATYDSCSFLCKPGQVVWVSAWTTATEGWPAAHAACGVLEARCQAYSYCSSRSGPATQLSWGTCHTLTVSTGARCWAA